MTLADLLAALRQMPTGTMVPAVEMAARLEAVCPIEHTTTDVVTEPTWRERLWTAPAETRIGRQELLEAVGRSENWLYRHTGARAKCSRIPCRKLDGELVFLVGEVRQWVLEHEETVVPARVEPVVIRPKRLA